MQSRLNQALRRGAGTSSGSQRIQPYSDRREKSPDGASMEHGGSRTGSGSSRSDGDERSLLVRRALRSQPVVIPRRPVDNHESRARALLALAGAPTIAAEPPAIVTPSSGGNQRPGTTGQVRWRRSCGFLPSPPKPHIRTPTAPFVYRLGRQIFNLKRRVRLP